MPIQHTNTPSRDRNTRIINSNRSTKRDGKKYNSILTNTDDEYDHDIAGDGHGLHNTTVGVHYSHESGNGSYQKIDANDEDDEEMNLADIDAKGIKRNRATRTHAGGDTKQKQQDDKRMKDIYRRVSGSKSNSKSKSKSKPTPKLQQNDDSTDYDSKGINRNRQTRTNACGDTKQDTGKKRVKQNKKKDNNQVTTSPDTKPTGDS
mmetsp:Transcript_70234/g.63035  ORF Transcript_70234/g.63035 Transcript_70234/m.63035 type:complete len:205 (-) Transcript_70234:2-616(-)